MTYRDLIQFEPIESVLKLQEADDKRTAQEHVDTFVVSPRLRIQLTTQVFPQLQFDAPKDNKGILVVGNYGTGKTHLMSVISAIAEYRDIDPILQDDPDLQSAIEPVHGSFKVARLTIGSTTKNLRNIVCDSLESRLREMEVSYQFPAQDEIENHIPAFQQVMEAFADRYPEKGLLLVVDELLDYLRTRNQQELMLDLSFLRELGEISSQLRFRIVAGLQESLFDNPAWANVSENVKRVKDRYEQVRIAREDVETVVSKRLLTKTKDQKDRIRSHLEQFTALYPTLHAQIKKFVNLFPVHPAYLEVFERIHITERREVLTTLSKAMHNLLSEPVPQNQPGLITYDQYWEVLTEDVGFRANKDVHEVLDRAETLEAKIKQSFPKPHYKKTAERIIHGLSVYRLTTPDIRAPIGLSPSDLRDELFLYVSDLPENEAEFLAEVIDVVMADILTTINGQFISQNRENQQYYLDVDKDIDYEQNISNEASMLPDDTLDQAYFDALSTVIREDPEAEPYVSGYRIWEHSVRWRDRNVDRPGYLFFGAPNERSTAQPPRDFYLYFLQPFSPPRFDDDERADEVFFDLLDPDRDEFRKPLLTFASASKLAQTAQGNHQKVYREKAREARRSLVSWLGDNLATECQVTWKGQTKHLKEWLPPGPHHEVRDMVEAVASVCLGSHFEDKYPQYPSFPVYVTRDNRAEYCKAAIREIVGSSSSKHGRAILDGLELLQDGDLTPNQSPYAQPVIDLLESKSPGQVVNRSELMEAPSPNADEVEKTTQLEYDLFLVVLTALCHRGRIVIVLPDEEIDASNEGLLLNRDLSELAHFRHVEKPKEIPHAALQMLCRMLEVNEHLVTLRERHDEMLQQIHSRRNRLLKRVVERVNWLEEPPTLWGNPYIPEALASDWRRELNDLKEFLESLQSYTSPAKLVYLRKSQEELQRYDEQVDLLERLSEREKTLNRLRETVKYLSNAELIVPRDHPWHEEVRGLKDLVATVIAKEHVSSGKVRELGRSLEEARNSYIEYYIDAHKNARLGPDGKAKKEELISDPRLEKLKKISRIELVDSTRLDRWIASVRELDVCHTLIPQELEESVKCPHCDFSPRSEDNVSPKVQLVRLVQDLEDMEEHWTETLLSDLGESAVEKKISLLDSDQQKSLQRFLEQGDLPSGEKLDLFVETIADVSKDLNAIRVSIEELKQVLLASGSATKPDKLKARFESFLADKIKDQHPDKIRIVFVEDGDTAD